MPFMSLLAPVSYLANTLATVPVPDGITRSDLQRQDLSVPGREMVQARFDIASDAVAPWHRHPGEEVIYVIEGTQFVPAGVAHKARNPGRLNGAELATYIVNKCKPLLVPAPEVEER